MKSSADDELIAFLNTRRDRLDCSELVGGNSHADSVTVAISSYVLHQNER